MPARPAGEVAGQSPANRNIPPHPVTLRLRSDRLNVLRQSFGVETDAALAVRMHMDPGTVSRVLRGKQLPGPRFIAQLVAAFPGWDIDDLFEVADDARDGAA